MNAPDKVEPVVTFEFDGKRITLLGTAHVSKASADKVEELLTTGEYDAVAVELCANRHRSIVEPGNLAKMDLLDILRKGKMSMVAASLALGAYQQRLAEQFNIEPGAEMRIAIHCAREKNLPVLLIDRDIGITLKRIYRNIPWWSRLKLAAGLLASVISSDKVSEAEIERLKEGDILETAFSEFADKERELFMPLIEERDRYMAARLHEELNNGDHQNILAVVGAGHLKGISRYLNDQQTASPDSLCDIITQLHETPPPGRIINALPWLIVIAIIVGFTLGFFHSSNLGWQMVADWVFINGGLAALGALIAMAHPITIIVAFVAAPLTSLNPMIGAGMVTAAVELFLHKPTVGDFSALRHDTAHVKGWWKNRVARILLVFVFSTIGSALGTYLAGFRIFGRLVGS